MADGLREARLRHEKIYYNSFAVIMEEQFKSLALHPYYPSEYWSLASNCMKRIDQ